MAVLFTTPEQQFFDNDGNPLAGGKLYTYVAGTTSPKATFTAQDMLTQNPNPVVLDASGRAEIWIDGSYKFVLKNASDVEIYSVDNVTSFSSIAEAISPYSQTFSGNGTQTSFTLSEDVGTDSENVIIFVDNGSPNYIANGTFATDTEWTKGTGWTIGSGVATCAGNSTDLEQNSLFTLIEGQAYSVTYTLAVNSGGLIPMVGGNTGETRTASGTYEDVIVAGSTQLIEFRGSVYDGTIDNVSVKLVASKGREVQYPDTYTVNGTALEFSTAPESGTNNILVLAPSLLLGSAAQAVEQAQSSASEAATSAAAALVSETNAATSEANASTIYDNFDDRYLGAKASDPTLDNDGDALLTGAIYFNTIDTVMKVYTGTLWEPIENTSSVQAVVIDTTITVGTGQDYATLALALDAVDTWVIAKDATLTISIADGTDYTTSTTQDIDHAYGNRIRVQPTNAPTDLTFSSLVSVTSNGAKDHDVIIEFTDVSSVSVGEMIGIRSLTGTGEFKTIEGCFEVTNVDSGNNRLTFNVADTRVSIGALTITGGAFEIFHVVLEYTDCTGLIGRQMFGEGSSSATGFVNIAFKGNGGSTYSAMLIEYGSTINFFNCAFSNFGKFGMYGIYGAVISAQNCYVSRMGSNGYYAVNGADIQAVGSVASGCSGGGFVASVGGSIGCTNSNSSGNLAGYFSSGSSEITGSNIFATGCTAYSALSDNNSDMTLSGATFVCDSTYGARSRHNSNLELTNADVTGAGTYDLFAEYGGTIYVEGATYGTLSPVLNTMDNMGALIYNGTLANAVNMNMVVQDLTVDGNADVTGTLDVNGDLTVADTVYPSGAKLTNVYRGTKVHAFNTISAGADESTTMTITGVSNNGNHTVELGYNGTTASRVIVTAEVTGTDTVTLTAHNLDPSTINSIGNRTYNVVVREWA